MRQLTSHAGTDRGGETPERELFLFRRTEADDDGQAAAQSAVHSPWKGLALRDHNKPGAVAAAKVRTPHNMDCIPKRWPYSPRIVVKMVIPGHQMALITSGLCAAGGAPQ